MKVVWTEPALADLEAIWEHIAADVPEHARRMVGRLLDAVEPLEDLPRMGRHIPEAEEPNLRELIVESYRIMYRVRPERVDILAVVHGSRDLGSGLPPWERLRLE
jgi:addiction module RelE/StbE family toxin